MKSLLKELIKNFLLFIVITAVVIGIVNMLFPGGLDWDVVSGGLVVGAAAMAFATHWLWKKK